MGGGVPAYYQIGLRDSPNLVSRYGGGGLPGYHDGLILESTVLVIQHHWREIHDQEVLRGY